MSEHSAENDAPCCRLCGEPVHIDCYGNATHRDGPGSHAADPVARGVCRSTRYGPGCGHPTTEHTGLGDCCCCNWQRNDPIHGAACQRCRPIIRAYLLRQYGDEPIPPEFREPGDPL